MNLIPGNLKEVIRVDAGQWFTDLVRVETRLWRAVDDDLRAGHGLTLGQYELMRVIADTDNCRVLDIVREIAITVGAASKAVDRIEALGWCRRTANPHDRRSSYLALTESGQRLLAAAAPAFRAAVAVRLSGVVTDDAVRQSGQTLAVLRKALEEDQRFPPFP